MKIYNMQNERNRRNKAKIVTRDIPLLLKAAGSEDKVMLSVEAMERFRVDDTLKNTERFLFQLALDHINDPAPSLEEHCFDQEFLKAEKLSKIAELVIRVVPSVSNKNIYSKMTGFVIGQL